MFHWCYGVYVTSVDLKVGDLLDGLVTLVVRQLPQREYGAEVLVMTSKLAVLDVFTTSFVSVIVVYVSSEVDVFGNES